MCTVGSIVLLLALIGHDMIFGCYARVLYMQAQYKFYNKAIIELCLFSLSYIIFLSSTLSRKNYAVTVKRDESQPWTSGGINIKFLYLIFQIFQGTHF